MIQIPNKDSKKHSVPNNSDLFGTLHYTKNINLDEEGYIKLSPRTASIISEKDNANMELPIAFGRTASASIVSFNVVTSEDPFTVVISETEVSATEDTGTDNPNFTLDSHGTWYRNLWTVASDTDFLTKGSSLAGATWTDRGNLTTAKAHPMETFRNRDTLCIGDGNTVLQFNNSYSASTTLTLPTDFEVIALSYSNAKMGVLTQLSDTVQGQDQEAFFFVWDGASTSATTGVPIGSDRGISVKAYKGSWVILTRAGQVVYYTGGGFQVLFSLPFYYRDLIFGTSYGRDLYGDVLQVEGDVIYMNFNGLFNKYGKNYEKYLPNNPGGILCYDPNIGLYQRYSHSISPLTTITVTSANVNTTSNIMTATAGTLPSTGNPIKYTSSTSQQIGGLATNTVYYIIKHTSTTFSLATSRTNAIAGDKVDLTSTGASSNYFLALETYDYGTTFANNIGGVALVGTNNGVCNHTIHGAQLNDFNSTAQYNHINLLVPDFDNIGYAVTSKIESSQVTDTVQKIFIKYRPLKTNDSIIVKIKTKDILGLPITTPQGRVSDVNQCIWSSASVFYTSNGATFADAKTAFDAGEDIECEVIAGAGAGSMVKVTNITESSGVYTVTLEEDVTGASASRYCDVKLENWSVLGTITSDDANGFKEFAIGKNCPWYKFKIELRGVDTTIENAQIINTTNQKAE